MKNNSMWTEEEMLSQLRRKSGEYQTQREMADFLKISESLLSKILKGERSITDDISLVLFGRKLVRLYVLPVEENINENT